MIVRTIWTAVAVVIFTSVTLGAQPQTSPRVQPPRTNPDAPAAAPLAPPGAHAHEPPWFAQMVDECIEGDQVRCAIVGELALDGRYIGHSIPSAIAFLEQMCDLGSAAACARVGREAPPTMAPLPQARRVVDEYQRFFNESDCEAQGNPRSCLLAGVAYLDGIGVGIDPAKARRLFQKACDAGLSAACQEIRCVEDGAADCLAASRAYAQGIGVPTSDARARQLASRACALGLAPACDAAAQSSPDEGPVSRDVRAAGATLPFTVRLARECDARSGLSCYHLAVMFRHGADVTQSATTAGKLLRDACDAGLSRGCRETARSAGGGPVTDAFFRRALELDTFGCTAGVPPGACTQLGLAYVQGEGVAPDRERGTTLVQRDCEFFRFGAMCREAAALRGNAPQVPGREEAELPSTAVPMIRALARGCDADGLAECVMLADVYANGRGLGRRIASASRLLTRACSPVFPGPCEMLARLPTADAAQGLRQLCLSGDNDACLKAAERAQAASPPDMDAAAHLLTLACSRGADARACDAMTALGDVVSATSLPQALELYRSSCLINRGTACARVALLLGVTEARSADRALDAGRVYANLCAAGVQDMCGHLWRLANFHRESPEGTPSTARAIWDAACGAYGRSLPAACTMLGYMVQLGLGGPRDEQRALQLYDQACGHGERTACGNFNTLEGTFNTVRFEIIRPVVTQRHTPYAQYVFRPNDEVYVQAGGCVQTGGVSDTWKRYVDPTGDSSDRLYHGTIWIPAVTGPFENIQGVIGRWMRVPDVPHDRESDLFLRLGYEDDDHSDNGYHDFDEGTDEQCRGQPDAWVLITVRRHPNFRPPPPDASLTLDLLPLDLWWDEVDDNLFPLNPRWGGQVRSPGSRPAAGPACNDFNNDDDRLDLGQGCTHQRPTVDEPAFNLFSTFSFLACHSDIGQIDPLPSDSVHGHVNWFPVTYTGKIYFVDFQDPALGSLRMPIAVGDNDYDWALVREDQAGTLLGSRFRHRSVGPTGLDIEFDSREVIDRIATPWWNAFHDAVDSHPAYWNDWTAAQSMVDGRDAIVIGLMGVDTKHTYHSELHPAFAMAIKIAESGPRQRWAFFVRNWGNEGGCSQDQHYLPDGPVSLFFPNGGRGPITIQQDRTIIGTTDAGTSWGARTFDDGLVMTFSLTAPDRRPLVYGELEFCTGPCGGGELTDVLSRLSIVSREQQDADRRRDPDRPFVARREDEGSLTPLLQRLSAEQRTTFTRLLDAERPQPADVLAARHTEPIEPARNDALVQARRRRLGTDEARVPVPSRATRDAAVGERNAAIRRALVGTLGEEEANRFVAEWRASVRR